MKASKSLPLVKIEFADGVSPDALQRFAVVGLVADFRAPSADKLPSMKTVDLMVRGEARAEASRGDVETHSSLSLRNVASNESRANVETCLRK